MSSEAAGPSARRSARPNRSPLPSGSVGRTTNDIGRVVVWVLGELDTSTAPELGEILDDLATRGRATLLDLSATTFMDGAGLAVILRASRTSDREGWSFVVADGASRAVTSLFDLAGYTR